MLLSLSDNETDALKWVLHIAKLEANKSFPKSGLLANIENIILKVKKQIGE
jgi:hypothetical protein